MPDFTLHKIQSLDLQPLQPYRTLRRSQEHLNSGIFVAEAEKVVRRFLKSDWEILSLLLTPEWFEEIIPTVREGRLKGVDIFVGEKSLLETIVGFTLHQGIMGVGKVPKEQPLSDTIAALPAPHFLVALDGLVHAENVGTVVRNCAGFGVDGIIAGKTSASPYLRRAVRNSMGGIFKMTCVHVEELAQSLATVQEQFNTRVIIADAHADTSIEVADFTGNICIVLGNEDEGVSKSVESIATSRARIPMHKGTDSLNVASASAVLLYEARRNRNLTM
jgi:tRNA G18 (ribose-2'-O)-methylase SpoU